MLADRPASLAAARRARRGVCLNVEARPGKVSLELASTTTEAQAWLSPDEADEVADDLKRAARAAREAR